MIGFRMDALARSLAACLESRATSYFPDLCRSDVRVHLLQQCRAPNSVVYHFRLSTERRHAVVVKQPRRAERYAHLRQPSRPMFLPLTDLEVKAQLEFATLSRIHCHFHQLADDRFGTVRPLDFFPEQRAIVMSKVWQPDLQHLLGRAHPLGAPSLSTRLEAAFRNAGCWLRLYHCLPPLGHTEIRHASRHALADSIRELSDFHAVHTGRSGYFREIAQSVEKSVLARLPEQLPLGMIHGDYGARNIFVGPQGRVAVFDTVGRWQAPVYTDLGRFLTAFKTLPARMYSQGFVYGCESFGQLEAAFLQGYFEGEPVPWAAVRLFELQALLERWAATVHALSNAAGLRWLAKRLRSLGWSRFFARYTEQLVRGLIPSRAEVRATRRRGEISGPREAEPESPRRV